jgi:hypothetical protein
MASKTTPWDWERLSDGGIAEIIRQGELMMAEMLTASCAADARAATLSGVYAAISAAMIAGGAALLTLSKPNHALLVTFGILSLGFMAASFLCVGATLPRDYAAAGNEPRLLVAAAAHDDRWLRTSSAEALQEKLDRNRNVLAHQAAWTIAGHRVAALALIVGAITFGVLYTCR